MTDAAAIAPTRMTIASRLAAGRAGPVAAVSLVILAIWYLGAIYMNAQMQIDRFEREETVWSAGDLVSATLSQERPLLPAPHQILIEMKKTIIDKPITSKRSLVFHSWVTLSSTLLGFAIGTALGVLLAVGIVHVKALEKSLMPWVISSQTIPILAIAPMVVVVLGAIGLKGLVPKAIISTYLCFFPITIGMVKGLRSPDPLQMDLMRTYSANRWQTFWLLRWPSSLPFLFASLKVAIAISLVGAIVGTMVALVGVVERQLLRRMGARP
jgi:NitT/TauT family transport system permease protein